MNKFFINMFAVLLIACSMISCALAQEIIFRDGFEDPAPSPPLPGSIHMELQPGAPTMISPPAGATQVVLFDGVLKNLNFSQFNLGRLRFAISTLDGGMIPFGSFQLRFVGSTTVNPFFICPDVSCVTFESPGMIGLAGNTEQRFQLLGSTFGGAGRRFVVSLLSPSDVGGFFIPSAALQVTGVPRSGPIIAPQ